MKRQLTQLIRTGAEGEFFTCRTRFARLDHDGVATVRSTNGVALRLWVDGRLGQAYGYGVPPGDLVADAKATLPYGPRSNWTLPQSKRPVAAPCEPLRNPPVSSLFSLQAQVLNQAEAALPGTPVTFAAETSVRTVHVLNTAGLDVTDRRMRAIWHLCTWSARGGLGLSRWWSGDRLTRPSTAELAEVWSEHRLLEHLPPTPVTSGRYPVLLAPEAAGALLLSISKRLSADCTQRWPIGFAVGSPLLNVVDDPHLAGGMYSASFDDEGVCTTSQALISRGVVVGHLQELATLRGAASAGSGFRRSLFHEGPEVEPRVCPSNLILQPGSLDQAELLKLMGSGLWVIRTLGDHLMTGDDFIVRCDVGFQIDHGEPRGVVQNVMLRIRLADLLQAVVALSCDLRPVPVAFRGVGYAPAILCDDLPVTSEG